MTREVEGLVNLRFGEVVPFIGIIYTGRGQIGLFTNRRNDEEVIIVLEDALRAIRDRNPAWRVLE